MRNIFKGGPLDGNVIMTEIITDGGDFVTYLPIEEYDGSNPPELGIDGNYQRTWFWTGVGVIEPGPAPRKNLDPEQEASAVLGEVDSSTDTNTPPEQSVTNTAGANTGWGSFRQRRESRGISRGPIADRAGLSVAKIARVETKGGTPAEIGAYERALSALEDE